MNEITKIDNVIIKESRNINIKSEENPSVKGIVIKNIIKSVPFLSDIINPIIDTIDDINDMYEMNNIKLAIEYLNHNLNELKDKNKFETKYLEDKQREFYFLFSRFLNAVYNEPDEEYVKYLSNYLSSCLNTEYSELKIKTVLLNKLAKYTRTHIEVLKMFSTYWKENNINYLSYIEHSDREFEFITKSISDITTIEYCIFDLVSDGFLKEAPGIDMGTLEYIPNTNNTLINNPLLITNMGTKCLEMIKEVEI